MLLMHQNVYRTDPDGVLWSSGEEEVMITRRQLILTIIILILLAVAVAVALTDPGFLPGLR